MCHHRQINHQFDKNNLTTDSIATHVSQMKQTRKVFSSVI